MQADIDTNLKSQTNSDRKYGPIALWFALRIVSIPVAGFALLYEHRDWALSSPRAFLLRPWFSYDTEYYVRIVRVGYRAGDLTSGFHPLYPWTAKILDYLLHDPVLSLLTVSSIAGFLLTIAFYRLAILDCTKDVSWTTTALFLCWPVTLAIFAPYTEALFLLLAVCCLLEVRKGQFWRAGLAGGLASLTRQHGIFLTLPMAWEIWEASGRNWRTLISHWQRALAIALVPAGYGVWIAYRAFAISDVTPDFSTPQHFIYSVMISPSHYKVFPNQQFLPPWVALWKAVKILWQGGLHWSAYGDALLGGVFIAMFVIGWRHLRTSYRLYSLAIILVALSYHTGSSVNPYTALPRHMLLAFPVFMGVAGGYKFHRLSFVLITLAICQALFLCCFVWQTWVL
jgi:hypothetical protein